MNLKDAIYNRRSVRSFTLQPVEREKIETLLDFATQAPSAMNAQPWAFAIIQDRNLLRDYSTRVKEYILNNFDKYPFLEKYKAAFENPVYNIFYNANCLIIIYAKPEHLYAHEDCCLAAQNIMLTAPTLGLGSCSIGFARPFLDFPEFRKEFSIPEDYVAITPIAIGYPKREVPAPGRKEPDILFWQTIENKE